MTPDELIETETSESDDTRADIAEDTAPDAAPVRDDDVLEEMSMAEEAQSPTLEQAPIPEVLEMAEESQLSIPEEPVTIEEPEQAEGEQAEPTQDDQGVEAETDETAEIEPEITLEEPEISAPARARVTWWPFAVYAVFWAALVAATYFLLQGPQADIPAFRQEAYPYLLLGGLVLMPLGPLLSLLMWFVAWRKAEQEDRGGLFTRAMIRGATVTFVGTAVWYAALNLVDVIRLGWI